MIVNKNEAHLKTNKNNSVELSIGSTPFDYTGTWYKNEDFIMKFYSEIQGS